MTNTNKKASINIFHVLKSVMDYKVRPLHTTADAGKRAMHEEALIYETLSALRTFISNNMRYNPGEAREAEAELADYESQLSAISQKVLQGKNAAEQLKHANKFYSTYKNVCRQYNTAKTLQGLESQRINLENQLAELDRRIEVCEINMTPNLYNEDIAKQSNQDYMYYYKEYENASKQLQTVIADIKSLQHQ